MLPKKSRIKRELFLELLSGSSYVHSPHFVLRFRVSGQKNSQVGVSVSKKVSKSAVTRNMVRRRVYAQLTPILKNYSGYFLLFVAKNGAQNIKGENLTVEIKQLLMGLK